VNCQIVTVVANIEPVFACKTRTHSCTCRDVSHNAVYRFAANASRHIVPHGTARTLRRRLALAAGVPDIGDVVLTAGTRPRHGAPNLSALSGHASDRNSGSIALVLRASTPLLARVALAQGAAPCTTRSAVFCHTIRPGMRWPGLTSVA